MTTLYDPDLFDTELRRYAFLSGYAMRTKEEEAEMVRLRESLAARGIEHGWTEVPRSPKAYD